MPSIYMLLVVLTLAVIPEPVSAQTQGSRGQAEAYFQQAEKLKQQAEALAARAETLRQAGNTAAAEQATASYQATYREAASNYYRAFELVRFPVLIFNMAQMYRLGGDEQNALKSYQSYVELEPSSGPAEQARRFIAELERALAAREKMKVQEEPSGTDSSSQSNEPVDTGLPVDTKEPDADETGNPGESGVDQPQKSTPGRGLRISGMASMGVGVIALGLGVKFGLDASSASDDLSRKTSGPWTDAEIELLDKGERAERNMILAYGLGSAALIGGGLLYYLGHRSGGPAEREAAVTLQPALAPGRVGVRLSAHF